MNVAAAAAGGSATASSAAAANYPVGAVINGDRLGASYYGGDVWHDATGATFPDWVEIAFAGSKTIDEVAVYGIQDVWDAPSEPSPTLTWRYWGVSDFTVQAWTGGGWQSVPGGVIRGNTLVKRSIAFAPLTTTRVRVLVEGTLDGWSRLTEVEAFESGGGTPGNTVPTIGLTSPAEGASAVAPATFTISATASDAEGPVANVAFYQNGVLIAQDASSPFSVPWTNVAAGSYTLTAVATDAGGLTTTSAPVHVSATTPGGGGARLNVAAASQGGSVTPSSTASSTYPAGAVINGDRRGASYYGGDVWHDATGATFPDSVEIAFAGSKTIDEIAVYGVQDAWDAPSEPSPTLTWRYWGVADFTVQTWTGSAWQTVPGGVIRGNTLVKRALTFSPLTTTRIRVLIEGTLDGWSRLTEVEAYQSGGGTPGNSAPAVRLTGPAEGASAAAPASFTVAAAATDAEGPVASVAFYQNGVLIAQDTASPFSVPWTNVAAGSYTLTAIVTDAGGLTTTSAPVHVTVTAPGGGTRLNVAAAAQGGGALASSSFSGGYPVTAVINGDRRGASYYGGDVWHDATGATFPDWVEVAFAGSKIIDEVDVYGVQDAWDTPSEPSPTLTWRYYGVSDFTVQAWTSAGWQTVPGGVVRGNTLVKRALTFPAVTTTRIRVLIEGTADGWSRLTEVEAFGSEGSGPSQTEWFVAPGGFGDGSSGNPFGRIQDAVNAAQPGDIVTLRSGTYAESLATVRNGVAGRPILLRSAAGRGSVVVTNPGRVLTVSHAYVTIDGLILDGQDGADDLVRVAGTANYLHLKNDELRRSSRDLVDMGATTGVLIEGCLLHHALNPVGGRSDAHGIVGGAVKDLTIRDTEIHTFSGDGIQVDAGRAAPGWDNLVVERTRIWLAPLPVSENGFQAGFAPGENAIDTKASASLPRARVTIRDFTAWGFRNGLITNMAALNLKEHVDAVVDRVTIFDSEIAFRLRGAVTGGAWVRIQNAVVYDVLTAFRYEDNIDNLRIWNSTVGAGVTRAFQAAASTSAGLDVRNLLVLGLLPAEASASSNLAVGTSAFTSVDDDDYSLAPGSPAIDAGTSIADVTTDRAGITRPRGLAFDVGAFERP